MGDARSASAEVHLLPGKPRRRTTKDSQSKIISPPRTHARKDFDRASPTSSRADKRNTTRRSFFVDLQQVLVLAKSKERGRKKKVKGSAVAASAATPRRPDGRRRRSSAAWTDSFLLSAGLSEKATEEKGFRVRMRGEERGMAKGPLRLLWVSPQQRRSLCVCWMLFYRKKMRKAIVTLGMVRQASLTVTIRTRVLEMRICLPSPS